ncbi:MAG TPA: ABC transporter permease [Stellaceae bacterium]|jgi:simple sugar transport system permease protein|nr:ABC transporter permease [Stellaceae bacterium]
MAEEIVATVPVQRLTAPSALRVLTGANAEAVLVPAGAIAVSLLLFGIFVAIAGINPLRVYGYMIQGAVGSWFSVQNTLIRAAPLVLTALCTVLPAQVGLMIIGGEGAFVIGGLCATITGVALHDAPAPVAQLAMAASGIAAGGLWIAFVGALRYWRGVNETISSLLLNYIAIAILNQLVEGLFRDPRSLNKPSSPSIGDEHMIGNIPGTEIHWGLVIGIVVCILAYILIRHTTIGFAARIAGGNPRAARMVGLPIGKLILLTCFLGGAAAGLAGSIEVAAIQESASADLIAGYGYTGILVAFLARQNPLAVVPIAVLLGGISASGGLLQRHLGLPDAATVVLQGMIFVCILASDTVYGRIAWFKSAAEASR